MRFSRIDEFSIDELHLDEGNYRFMHAADQSECISKLYKANPPAFSNLMESIAEDDLGELLLVYMPPEGAPPIVMDGNRRTAALKVLHDPGLSPSKKLQAQAVKLAKRAKVDFEKIQAQTSDDKAIVLRTVYERHAAGQGRSRINWNALANAKFRYQEGQFDGQDWHDIALLMELEARGDEVTEFINGKGYSHEVFRRVVRIAEQMGVLDASIFSERDQRIKKSQGRVLENNLDRVKDFLRHMQAGNLTLSRRGGTYADKSNIESYLEQFLPPSAKPEIVQQEVLTEPQAEGASSPANGQEPVAECMSETGDSGTGPEGSGPVPGREDVYKDHIVGVEVRDPTKIPLSPLIANLINSMGHLKLGSLYSSLTTISFKSHPVLCMAGAWSFLEAISRGLGATSSTAFDSFLGSKASEWFPDKNKAKTMRSSLSWISSEGNCNKHDEIYMTINAVPLAVHFSVLEPLIAKALEQMIDRKKSRG